MDPAAQPSEPAVPPDQSSGATAPSPAPNVLDSQFLAAYAKRALVIDCPSMQLTQCGAAKGRQYVGRGMIAWDGADQFTFRLYADPGTQGRYASEVIEEIAEVHSAGFIPDNHYFELASKDLAGRAWSCPKARIKVHGHIASGVVVTGTLERPLVNRSSAYDVAKESVLHIYFFNDLEVPFEKIVETQQDANGQTTRIALKDGPTEFEADGVKFQITKADPEKGGVVLMAWVDAKTLPQGLETRALEALRYVTHSMVYMCIVQKWEAGRLTTIVAPHQPVVQSFFRQPLPAHLQDRDFWELFKAYFAHVSKRQGHNDLHPLSIALLRVITADTKQLDVLGMLISVAVEGVLKAEFPDVAKPTSEFIGSLDQITSVIDGATDTDPDVKSRLLGSVNAMKLSRPKDKFKVLVLSRVITPEMVDAWNAVRNATAHADSYGPAHDIRDVLRKYWKIQVLLNRLVFQAIGYSGRYYDYAAQGGSPIVQFTPVTLDVAKCGNSEESEPHE